MCWLFVKRLTNWKKNRTKGIKYRNYIRQGGKRKWTRVKTNEVEKEKMRKGKVKGKLMANRQVALGDINISAPNHELTDCVQAMSIEHCHLFSFPVFLFIFFLSGTNRTGKNQPNNPNSRLQPSIWIIMVDRSISFVKRKGKITCCSCR